MIKIQSTYQLQLKHATWTLLFFVMMVFLSLFLTTAYDIASILSYLPLHTLFELVSVIISVMIFGVAWVRIQDNSNSRNYIILACAFLGVAILDVFHVFSFPGMPEFITPNGSEKTINFWLMARYLSAFSLLIVSVLSWHTIATRLMHNIVLGCVLTLVITFVIIGLFFPSLIPSTYIEGQGLTSFKIMSEYSITVLYFAVGIRLLYLMRTPQPFDIVNLFTAACLMALSDFFFTLYFNMNDIFNFLGHIYKIIAYWYIYKSIFMTSVVKPYEELAESRNLLSTIIEAIPVRVFWKNSQLQYVGCNTQFANDAGMKSPEELIGKLDDDLPWHEIAKAYQQDDQFVLDTGKEKLNFEEDQLTPTGERIRLRTSKAPVYDRNNDVAGMVGIYEDITAWCHSQEKIKLAASVFMHARESIIISDIAGTIVDVNDAFTTATGYSREEVIGENARMLQSGQQLPQFYSDMWRALLKEGYWSSEMWNCRKNGELLVEKKTISAVKNEQGIITHYVALGYDITRLKEHQNELEHIAHYDMLTNLPNRVLLADRLSQAMLQCQRNKNLLAVAFLDLDSFKAINDTYGHDIGDKLLVALSVRMKKALREGDSLARLGGDEFVAILTGLTVVEDCEAILNRFLLAASSPVTVDDVVLSVSVSIGVTLYPQDDADADQLIRHADQAMYIAKELGKNRYHLFDTAQDDAIKQQRENLEAIRDALDNKQFVLHYQPKVNMKTGSVTGVEALIRWQHPKKGLLNPLEFLPTIENNPMMVELGEWVIETALMQISQWQAMGLKQVVNISVNIAAVHIQQSNFISKLTSMLAAYPDVSPQLLELEVLETSALDDVNHVSTIMNTCMTKGVKFALDDFGTGYSSLTYLRRLPAQIIKIDQSFVRDMLDDDDDLAIIEGVIALARSFDRDVIAEGVETIEHGTALLQLGCELAQGYGIAKPMPADDIPSWVSCWKPDKSWQAI